MRLTINIFTVLSSIISLVSSQETYLYEKQNFFGLGRRVMPKPRRMMLDLMSNRAAYPDPLPTPQRHADLIPSPYKTLYQGTRIPNDTRVFRRRFDFEATNKGQRVMCEGMFNCIITFLAVESTEATPVILRGGAGYRHFTALVKAKAGKELKGQFRAYCRTQEEETTEETSFRRFNLKEQKHIATEKLVSAEKNTTAKKYTTAGKNITSD